MPATTAAGLFRRHHNSSNLQSTARSFYVAAASNALRTDRGYTLPTTAMALVPTGILTTIDIASATLMVIIVAERELLGIVSFLFLFLFLFLFPSFSFCSAAESRCPRIPRTSPGLLREACARARLLAVKGLHSVAMNGRTRRP